MTIFDRAAKAVGDYVYSRISEGRLLLEAAGRFNDGAVSRLINAPSMPPSAKSLDDWKRAIAAAKDPDNPDWTLLADLHENLLLDDHLESLIESRNAYTKRSAVKFVNAKGEENEELQKLFERPWYGDMVDIVLGHRYKGVRLFEMYEVNADNELKKIKEIPQANFNGKKGFIKKNSTDTEGWSYTEGVFADSYIQVGEYDNYGMLTKMAPIVLAKKLGMGAWLDFIDKYGVPPLFITTDREDNERLDQLWNAAIKFKRNNFMVGRGQEKFEVGDIGSSNVDPMEKLADRADNMMSKRIMGGTSLTDEKSFVGSTQIQYKMAVDRFESDRLLWKYFFNTEIRPRLIKLSPVYAALKDYLLEYDDTERLGQKEKTDLIVSLGQIYDIDPEYVTEVTGIPILGVKQSQPFTPAPGGGDQKK